MYKNQPQDDHQNEEEADDQSPRESSMRGPTTPQHSENMQESTSERCQFIKEALAESNQELEECARNDSIPPGIIYGMPEDQSCTSSVTLHFQSADLFVSSLYPCTQASNCTHDIDMHYASGEEKQIPTVAEEDAKTPITVDQDLFKWEMKKLAGALTGDSTAAAKEVDGFDTRQVPQQTDVTSHILVLDHQAENKPIKHGDDGRRRRSVGIAQSGRLGPPVPHPFDELADIMPMPSPHRTELLPGAHPVSTPGQVRSGRSSPYNQEHPGNNHPHECEGSLVEAKPVSSLQVAVPEGLDSARVLHSVAKQSRVVKCWLVAAFVAAGGFILLSSLLYKSFLPSSANPTKLRQMHIKSMIEEEFGMDFFDSKEKEKALHWIVYEDPQWGLETRGDFKDDTTDLIQRFVLASFYFQTSTRHPWRYCNQPERQQSELCYAVEGTKSKQEKRAVRWLSNTNECHWMGIYCNEGIVYMMVIAGNNMTGHLPSELSKLSSLSVLVLTSNHLTGSLPRWMDPNPFPLLREVQLDRNSLIGTIPPGYFAMQSVDTLTLGGNQFTGTLSSQVGSYKGRMLMLGKNKLVGPLPNELYSLSRLEALTLSQNLISGTLSSRLGQLQSLTSLYITSCDSIAGPLPSEIGLLSDLRFLFVTNTKINGTIPEELFNAAALGELDLSGTGISGTISSRIGLLTNLQTFLIGKTQVRGSVPSALSLLSKLQKLEIQENDSLQGSVPQELCSKLWKVRSRRSYDISADCTPSASTGKSAVACPKYCCTTCCDAETHICTKQ